MKSALFFKKIRQGFLKSSFLSRNKGFSLVEIMVAVSIFVGLMFILFAVLSGGRRAWHTSEAQIDVNAEIRKVMAKITAELSEAGPGNVSITSISANEDRITFRVAESFTDGSIVWSDQIQYALGGINGEQVIRTNLDTAATEILGNYMTTMLFTQPTADIVAITLISNRQSLQGNNLQLQLNSQVSLRNR